MPAGRVLALLLWCASHELATTRDQPGAGEQEQEKHESQSVLSRRSMFHVHHRLLWIAGIWPIVCGVKCLGQREDYAVWLPVFAAGCWRAVSPRLAPSVCLARALFSGFVIGQVLGRPGRDLGPTAHSQFVSEVLDVALGGSFGDMQEPRDLRVGAPVPHRLRHLHLPLGEPDS